MTTAEAINAFINRYLKKERLYTIIGTVSDVNETTRKCDVTPLEGAKIFGCRLQSVESSSVGVVPIPANGSKVAVTFRNNQTGIVSLCEEITKYIVTIGTSEWIVTNGLFEFNGGANEGLINIAAQVAKINDYITSMNTFITTKFNLHIHTAPSGATGVPSVTDTAKSVLDKNDFEDTKVTH